MRCVQQQCHYFYPKELWKPCCFPDSLAVGSPATTIKFYLYSTIPVLTCFAVQWQVCSPIAFWAHDLEMIVMLAKCEQHGMVSEVYNVKRRERVAG